MIIRLVLAVHQPVVLLGLQTRFQFESDLRLVASCQTVDETLRAVQHHTPQILLLDLAWHDNLKVLQELAEENNAPRVVLFPATLDDEQAMEALRSGVVGIVLKDMSLDLLVQCVRKVQAGGHWLEMESAARVIERMVQRETRRSQLDPTLTSREIEILRLVGNSLRNKEIAAKLCVSDATVRNHVHHLYSKLQLASRGALVAYARQQHLL